MTQDEIAEKKRLIRGQMAQDRQQILMRFPFTGAVAMRLDLVPVHDCCLDTCSTDGERVYADIGFYAKLNAKERQHVLAHEIWHCILLHLLRRQDRDMERFNYAADLEIYFLLVKEGMGIPFHLAYLRDWTDKSAEEIYERLPELESAQGNAPMANERGFVPAEASPNIRPVCENGGFDRHVYHAEDREGSYGGEAYYDEEYQPGWTAHSAERIREIVVSAAQQVERNRGELPGHLRKMLDRMVKPEVKWQEHLAQFVTSCLGGDRRWLPPNRRYVGQGLYLQSRRSECLRAVVAVDTSGSTSCDLTRFFSELNSLMGSFGRYELTVIQADARVKAVERFDSESPCPPDRKWEVSGSGGTDFRPVFEYVERHPEIDPACLLYFTDGLGPAPKQAPGFPVLWMLTRDGEKPATWGSETRFCAE